MNNMYHVTTNPMYSSTDILDFSERSFTVVSLNADGHDNDIGNGIGNSNGNSYGYGRGNGNGNGFGHGTNKGNIPNIYISGSDDGSGFNVEIHFIGEGWTNALKGAFVTAADFLSAIVIGDRPDYIANNDPNQYFDQDIDDIMITASLTDIDGSGGILARAGPTHLIYDLSSGDTSLDALPFAGIMQFDISDAQSYLNVGTWDDLVLHEMLHTLGLGTLWLRNGIVDLDFSDNGTPETDDDIYNYTYNGSYASAFTDDPRTLEIESPQIEGDGIAGTRGSHWDEDTYDNELMTGYIDQTNILSQMSVASLADLGYIIDWQADEYIGLA